MSCTKSTSRSPHGTAAHQQRHREATVLRLHHGRLHRCAVVAQSQPLHMGGLRALRGKIRERSGEHTARKAGCSCCAKLPMLSKPWQYPEGTLAAQPSRQCMRAPLPGGSSAQTLGCR